LILNKIKVCRKRTCAELWLAGSAVQQIQIQVNLLYQNKT